jgi:O-antigen ligase
MNIYTENQSLATEKGYSDQLYFYTVCLLSIVIPFPYIFSSIVIILLAFLWLFTGIRKNVASFFSRRMLWIWILFFALHCLSYFYSTDKPESLFDIQSKLSFFVLPIIIGTGPSFNQNQFKTIVRCFIGSVLLLALISFSYSFYFYDYLHQGGLENFFYNNMVRFTEANAVYVAWYTLTAIFILIGFGHSYLKMNKALYVFFLLLLQIYFFSLSARLLIIIEAVLILPYAYYCFKKNHRELPGLVFSIMIILSMAMVALTENPISTRYKIISPAQTKDWLIDKNDDSSTQEFTNVTLRLFIWKTAIESIKENQYYYYGCGNGDIRLNQKNSIDKYTKNLSEGNRKAELWKYNIHNSYLHTLYMLGIPGLSILLLLIFMPLRYPLPKPFKLFSVIFIVTSALFMFIEAALQTQAGIVFFTFFSTLMAKVLYSKSND